jgi:pyruvate dehydrogenase E1 component
VPTCQAYDPAFAYEVGVIIQAGLERMYGPTRPTAERDVIYYLTLYNENYPMPALPEGRSPEVEAGRGRGLYRFADAPEGPSKRATILFSGRCGRPPPAPPRTSSPSTTTSPPSCGRPPATSGCARRPSPPSATTGCTRRSEPGCRSSPSCSPSRRADHAVTDFMKVVPDQVARFVPEGRPFHVLGTDGMGRSDTREALRRFFEVDTGHVVVAVLTGLLEPARSTPSVVEDAIRRYDIDPDAVDPYLVYCAGPEGLAAVRAWKAAQKAAGKDKQDRPLGGR